MEGWSPNSKYEHVFAIVRVDTFHDMDTPVQDTVTVKKVVWSRDTAEQEVARLNELNSSKGSVYFWTVTRLERIPIADTNAR
jgi:hypothetical protein